MNEVKIIVTVDNRTFQDFERIRRHIRGIFDDQSQLGGGGGVSDTFSKTARKAGEAGGKALKEGLSFSLSALKDAPWELKAAGAAVGGVLGVTAGAAAAAVLTGGVLAGAAVGGIVGGLKLAAQSPEVQDAASVLGSSILAELQEMARSAGFADASIAALDQLGEAWDRNSTHVREALYAAAKYVEPLTDAVEGFGERILPKITLAIQRAGPVVDVLKTGLPQLGEALGKALDDMTRNADEGAAALQMVFDIVSITVIALGNAVDAGAKFYNTLLDVGSAVSGAAEDIIDFITPFDFFSNYLADVNDEFERLRDIADGSNPKLTAFSVDIKGTAGEMRDAERAAKGVQRAVDEMNAAFEDAFDTMMDVESANIDVKLGFIDLRKELQELGKVKDADSEKGLRQKDAINEQIQLLDRQRQAAIDAGAGSKEATDTANAAYVAGIDALKKMLKELGLLTPALEKYLAQWRELAAPKVISITAKVNVVESGGRTPARGTYAQAAGGLTPTSVFGAASGMMIGGGSLTEVGEYGRELVRLPPSAQVYNHGTSNRMLDALGSGGGGRVAIEVYPAPSFTATLSDEMIKNLRFRVRNEAGGDVNAFFSAY